MLDAAHKFHLQNPRYDVFVTEDGRHKKLKKALPPGLSAHDERVLKTVQRKAYRYEWWIGMFFLSLLEFPNMRICWSTWLFVTSESWASNRIYAHSVYLCDELED